MKTISGQLVSMKPVSLTRAAKLISRFAAVDNGSSPAVSIYLQRAANAFNYLVQYHSKPLINGGVRQSSDWESIHKLQTDELKAKLVGKKARDVESREKTDSRNVHKVAEEKPPQRNEVDDLRVKKEEQTAEEKKERRKRKGGEFDPKEKSSRKKKEKRKP